MIGKGVGIFVLLTVLVYGALYFKYGESSHIFASSFSALEDAVAGTNPANSVQPQALLAQTATGASGPASTASSGTTKSVDEMCIGGETLALDVVAGGLKPTRTCALPANTCEVTIKTPEKTGVVKYCCNPKAGKSCSCVDQNTDCNSVFPLPKPPLPPAVPACKNNSTPVQIPKINMASPESQVAAAGGADIINCAELNSLEQKYSSPSTPGYTPPPVSSAPTTPATPATPATPLPPAYQQPNVQPAAPATGAQSDVAPPPATQQAQNGNTMQQIKDAGSGNVGYTSPAAQPAAPGGNLSVPTGQTSVLTPGSALPSSGPVQGSIAYAGQSSFSSARTSFSSGGVSGFQTSGGAQSAARSFFGGFVTSFISSLVSAPSDIVNLVQTAMNPAAPTPPVNQITVVQQPAPVNTAPTARVVVVERAAPLPSGISASSQPFTVQQIITIAHAVANETAPAPESTAVQESPVFINTPAPSYYSNYSGGVAANLFSSSPAGGTSSGTVTSYPSDVASLTSSGVPAPSSPSVQTPATYYWNTDNPDGTGIWTRSPDTIPATATAAPNTFAAGATQPSNADISGFINSLNGGWTSTSPTPDELAALSQAQSDIDGTNAEITAWQRMQEAGLCGDTCQQSLATLESGLPAQKSALASLNTKIFGTGSSAANQTPPSSSSPSLAQDFPAAQTGQTNTAPSSAAPLGMTTGGSANVVPVRQEAHAQGSAPATAPSAASDYGTPVVPQTPVAQQTNASGSTAEPAPLLLNWIQGAINWWQLVVAPTAQSQPCSLLQSLFGRCSS